MKYNKIIALLIHSQSVIETLLALTNALYAWPSPMLLSGEFFLGTTVTWVVAGSTNGGPIFRPVHVSDGERIRIVISP